MIRNRTGSMCVAAIMLAALFVAPPARSQSTAICGALCTTSVTVPALVDLATPAQAFVNVGVSSTDAKTYSGQLILVVGTGSDFSLSATCRVNPNLRVTYPSANTAQIPYIGITKDGRAVEGMLTVTEADPVKHLGTFSFTEFVKSASASTSVAAANQPCYAHVVAPPAK